MKEKAKQFEEECAAVLRVAALAMLREFPDYGECERMISRAQSCINYARQCNDGKFRGEEW